jgi:transcriptional regulator with XRE-family HTH domain
MKNDKHHYVREWRKYRGLTQERLAERTPFTIGAISQLETGRTKYTQDMIEALAVALDCKPGDLLSRDPNREAEVISIFEDLKPEQKATAIKMIRALAS